MITSINIKNVATYDPVNGVDITDLKKVNFFFGFNGSGKSTIAKYLHNLSLDADSQNPDFGHCSNVGYNITQHQILTFNEDFIDENFKRNRDLKGVFSLNQSNAIIDQQITDEEALIRNYEFLIRKYNGKIDTFNNDKKAKYNALLNHCWNQRATFSTFTKISLAQSGSKSNHLQEIKKILQNPIGQVLPLQDLIDNYQSLYEKELKKIGLKVDVQTYLAIRRLEVRLDVLLQEVIVGNEDVDIAGLIQTLNSRNWVEQGLKFLENLDSTCPFCQKPTIDSELKEQFSKFFDETYKKKIVEIEGLRNSYKQKSSSFLANITAIQNEFNPNNRVSNLVIALTSLFDDNLDVINYKIEHSNERKAIASLSTEKVELSEIIKLIKANDQLFEDADSNRRTLLEDIWKFIANNCQQEIQTDEDRVLKYTRLAALANELKAKNERNIATSRQKIKTLRSQTVSTADTVDEINLILKNAGFEGFEIAEKDRVNNISRYFLKRPNSTSSNPVFESLSEGEKNFISFLYFYQLCLGTDDLQNNGSKKKIIVIDDPVSSLDSQSMFIVSTLIHSLILRKANDNRPNRMLLKNTDILQVFVLTHNFYFYKEVSFNKRPICTDWWHYRIIKSNNKTSISGGYDKTINDDYNMLWKSIKELKDNIPQNSSRNILIANSMRRIIESYVSFIGYGNDSWAALLNSDLADPTYYIKSSFISTINDESHKISALDSLYYQKIINEQPQVLFDVFLSIFKVIGKEHYEMMMDEQIQP